MNNKLVPNTINNSLDLSILDTLKPEEKALALSMLQEYLNQGESKKLNDILLQDYEEIPVDIDTFLHDPQYLGQGLYDGNGKFTVFPYWVKTLKKIFPTNIDTAYNTLILTGGIGLGKSFIADICMLYLLYRMLCLKDPYTHYGLQPIDKITFSFMNMTLDAARGVAWDKLQQLVQCSPWFMSRGFMRGTSNAHWEPPKGIELIVGSQNRHVIGRAVFSNFTDEADFSLCSDVAKAKKKTMTLISQVDARMQSRFMKGTKLPTLQIIASSKSSEQAFMQSYINMKRENNSTTTLVIDEPQWVIRDDKDNPVKFYVAIGNKFMASEVIPKDSPEEVVQEFRDKGYELLKVPIGYYQNFLENIDIALTDIAGRSTSDSTKFISGKHWKLLKDKNYVNPFTKEIISVGTAPDDKAQYYDFFDMSKVDKNMMGHPLFIHLDMSTSGDRTGIAGVWIKGKVASGESDLSKELYYQLAFSVAIEAPKGYQISYQKTRQFLKWLRSQGFAIKSISSDTFQATMLQQELSSDGFKMKTLSVDRLQNVDVGNNEVDETGATVSRKRRICVPYQYFKTVVQARKLLVYDKCDLLTDEVIGLEKEADGHINHPNGGKSGSKDLVDAVCGATYMASLFAEQYAYEYGETVEQILDVNKNNYKAETEQMVVALEDELKKMNPAYRQLENMSRMENNNYSQGTTDYILYSDDILII